MVASGDRAWLIVGGLGFAVATAAGGYGMYRHLRAQASEIAATEQKVQQQRAKRESAVGDVAPARLWKT